MDGIEDAEWVEEDPATLLAEDGEFEEDKVALHGLGVAAAGNACRSDSPVSSRVRESARRKASKATMGCKRRRNAKASRWRRLQCGARRGRAWPWRLMRASMGFDGDRN